MTCRYLEFAGPGRVGLRTGPAPQPGPGQVLVATRYSAISPGTELLIYRGQWPQGVPLDATIESLAGPFRYPLSYGYCTVGRVIGCGRDVADGWLGRRVFAFQPHRDLFAASCDSLVPIPEELDDETALFLPAMETAVTLLHDGAPLLGDQVTVIGQGIIGLLTTALLATFPLAKLTTLDRYPLRRHQSMAFGASACYDPAEPDLLRRLGSVEGQGGEADLVFEVSGNPSGLATALALIRFSGRIVVGSWYGTKRAELDLGSFFHRGRVSLISSQVSSLTPGLTGRWQPGRRLQVAWEMLGRLQPAGCITHRFPLAAAAEAYQLLDHHPEETIQVIFDHQFPLES